VVLGTAVMLRRPQTVSLLLSTTVETWTSWRWPVPSSSQRRHAACADVHGVAGPGAAAVLRAVP
jgi:hypothetical protein